jgi:hypothetical protein
MSTAGTNRYSDAYVVARTIDGVGLTMKIIGFLIGALLALASLASAKGALGMVFAFMGIAVAGAIATVLFLLGTLASAQGQLLKATLDIAVNTARFLTDEDRARIMSLPNGSPGAPGAVLQLSAPQAEWKCGCGQTNAAGTTACLACGVRYRAM